MRFFVLSLALMIILGTFIYTMNFALWLFRSKEYRGAIGVFLLGVIAVVVPMYALFRQQ
ncbi:MAG: hypothetical protein ACYDG6_03350 [Thermincolia bacterium]